MHVSSWITCRAQGFLTVQSPVPQEATVETSRQWQISPRFRTENILCARSPHISATSLFLAWPQAPGWVFLYSSLGRGAALLTGDFARCDLSFFFLSKSRKQKNLLIYFLIAEIGSPHMLQHSCFTPKTETQLGHVSEIYFYRLWICSVQRSWLLQWTKQITILISHLANSISVILQLISQPNAFCSTTVYLSLEAKLYDELW